MVAKVNGAAVAGGMALVTLSHLAVASTTARFGTPEINVGAFPNMVMAGILRAIPKKAAMKMILLGEILDAQEALDMGLVNTVVAPEALDETVANIAARLSEKSSSVFGLGLDSIRVSSDLPYPQALEYLCEMATIIRNTDDCQEGAKAFLEKRKPQLERTVIYGQSEKYGCDRRWRTHTDWQNGRESGDLSARGTGLHLPSKH